MESSKKYELRELKAVDVFPMAKIISLIGLKNFTGVFNNEEVMALINGSTDNANLAMSVGIEIAFDIADIVLGNLDKCEDAVFRFLSGLSGIPVKQLHDLSPATFMEMIVDVFQKEEFADFFSAVLKLLKRE